MKGLILCGGKGTRLYPVTYTLPKQLLPLANKPILLYAIETLIEAGIYEIGIVVGDRYREIKRVLDCADWWTKEVEITYIHQHEPLGLAHAVKVAQPFFSQERFVLLLGDNLVLDTILPLVRYFSHPTCKEHCIISLAEVADPTQFGIAEVEIHNNMSSENNLSLMHVHRLVEKPALPPSNLALVGIYFFDSSIFSAIEMIQPSIRGELEITDAIQQLIDLNYNVRAYCLKRYWADTGSFATILDANQQILMKLSPTIDPGAVVTGNTELQGNVTLQAGVRIENSMVQGPAIIGEGTVIRNAYIGPFTSIDRGVTIEASNVERSILLNHCRIINVRPGLKESLVGRYAEIYGVPVKNGGHTLFVSDQSRIGIEY